MFPRKILLAEMDLSYTIPGGILGALILLLDIIVIFEIVKDASRTVLNKVLWGLLVLLFPILGVIIYFLFERPRAGSSYERLLPS